MSRVSDSEREFDLQPDPRILRMLGEISLVQWRCLAEFIDNSVDSFLSPVDSATPIREPRISITLPTSDASGAKITVRDNGPGMTPDVLEKAVRAGWSGNDPISKLGMFGMGFNIATARLGTVTSVWTTTRNSHEWCGLEIDFDRLVVQRSFRTPRLYRPKAVPDEHGTEVTVQKLKPEQRQWFAKGTNRSRIVKDLGRVYSSMLRTNGVPVSFELTVNNGAVRGREHCIWGGDLGPDRIVPTGRYGDVSAYQVIETTLPARDFCTRCWQWLPPNDEICPECDSSATVVVRQRRVHGWLGIQRYVSASEYGIDLLRHGRKVEIGSKDDFFVWKDGDVPEDEYPIDDPRHRGRIVGEVHIDHCRVSYMKDRFDRNDPAWEEMIHIVRGRGPLRPDRAAGEGYGSNDSPLYLLFQAFRRNSPKPKVAGCYARLLMVPDNESAEEMAGFFHNGDSRYLTDDKWWALVEEADSALLAPGRGEGETERRDEGFVDGDTDVEVGGRPTDGGSAVLEPPAREAIPSLTREYRDDVTDQRWNVHAFSVAAGDPALVGGSGPWVLTATAAGVHEFLVATSHLVFRSATLTALDALLAELAWQSTDFARGGGQPARYANVLAQLRARYAGSMALDPVLLAGEASSVLNAMASSLASTVPTAADRRQLFGELQLADQEAILSRMAARAVANPQALVDSGRFLEFAPRQMLLRFFESHPELFMDGHFWDARYATIDYEVPSPLMEARMRTLRHYSGLLYDAAWLAEQDTGDLVHATRARLLRAALALELLTPTPVAGSS